ALTEQGVAMLASVLRSRRAVQVNIAIMRTFWSFAGDAPFQCRPGRQAWRPGEEIRRTIQNCVRRHPRTDDSSRVSKATDRFASRQLNLIVRSTHPLLGFTNPEGIAAAN